MKITHGLAPCLGLLGKFQSLCLPMMKMVLFERMNFHLLQGHVSRSGDRNQLLMDQFVKIPKSQIKSYAMHPDPFVSCPGKSMNKWSGEASPLNSSFTRIPNPLMVYLLLPGLGHCKTCANGRSLLRRPELFLTKLLPTTGVSTRYMMTCRIISGSCLMT